MIDGFNFVGWFLGLFIGTSISIGLTLGVIKRFVSPSSLTLIAFPFGFCCGFIGSFLGEMYLYDI